MVIKGKISQEWRGKKVFAFFKTFESKAYESSEKTDIISIDNEELEFEIDTKEVHDRDEEINIYLYCKDDINNITHIGNYAFNGVGELLDDNSEADFPNFLINGDMIMFPAYGNDSHIYKKLLTEGTLDYISEVDEVVGI